MADQWYFAHDNQQQGPVPVEQLRSMITAGSIRPIDLVWCEGMPQWKPANQVPELAIAMAQQSSTAPPAPHMLQPGFTPPRETARPKTTIDYSGGNSSGLIQLTPRALDMLRGTRPWVRLVGVLILIATGLMLLAPIALVLVAVLGSGDARGRGVFIGMAIMNALVALLYLMPGIYLNRYASRIAELEQTGREDLLESALEAQKSFWKFMGILILIGFVFGLLGAIFAAIGAGVAASA